MSNKAQGRDGLPLRLAIVGFATEQWRENAAIYARLEASPRIRTEHIAGTQKLLWSESLLLRLLDGELVAYGVPHGGRVAEVISHDILRDAEPDFRANTLTCGITFRSIRIYEIATAPEIAHSDPAAPTPNIVDQAEPTAPPSKQAEPQPDPAAGVYRTGSPGRPSSAHLYLAEMEARCSRNELASQVTQEAKQLRDWLRKNHPDAPPPTIKAIRNKISSRYRDLKTRPKI